MMVQAGTEKRRSKRTEKHYQDGSILVMSPEAEFRKQVAKFREWADHYATAQERGAWEYGEGEWECNYSGWPDIWAATVAFLDASPPAQWSDEVSSELLYILARDNEDERIKEEMTRRPDCLLVLAKRGLRSKENDARWQLADALGAVAVPDADAGALLLHFYNDNDEYVSRRALLALCNRKCGQAEALALRSWGTGLEYQQIAALHVLSRIESAQFEAFRQMAERDPRRHLASAAMRHAVQKGGCIDNE